MSYVTARSHGPLDIVRAVVADKDRPIWIHLAGGAVALSLDEANKVAGALVECIDCLEEGHDHEVKL